MLGILCIYSKELSKRGILGTFLHQNVIQHCGCLCCLTPQLLPLSHCESCMIHHCSCSSHNCHKCFLYHSILLFCPWGCILKNNPNSSLSDSLSRTLFSPALSHLIIFTWILCLAFKAFTQSIIGSTCSFFFLRKKPSCTLLLHPPTLPNVVFLPCLVFSLMRCPNTSFLQDP